jgi:UDP-N-acetylmuramoyl-tripeptide--D-alanyl-D-alanine ligase
MLELGEWSWALHETCGRVAAATHVDALVAIGGDAADGLVAGALAGGLASQAIHRFADSGSAAPHVAALVQPGDLVLVKGSRGTRTDLVADRLREVA